ncbi:Aldo/keto reductase [Thozetella sp. PMI_491]|nr:Aldo/keto reductase [Thozetella sp. PMI_491]
MFSIPIPSSVQESLDATEVEYVKLGSSGLSVSFPVLGAMSMGTPELGKWILDENTSMKLLKAAYDRGINTWDTSNAYSNGMSEAIIGKTMREYNIPREKIVIMTKCAFWVGEHKDIIGHAYPDVMARSKDYVNQGGLSRRAIFSAVEGSLARLGTSYIDLLQIQRYDPTTPPEETMRALHDLVQAGKVRYIGASSMWATQFAEMQFIAEKHDWTKFISMQNCYSLCYREEEREMIRFCKRTGVGLVPWGPLFTGRLARPLEEDKNSSRSLAHHGGLTAADKEIIRRVEELAKKKDWPMSHVALAWHRNKGTIPIVGVNSMERVEDVSKLRGKVLTEEEVAYLEEPYEPKKVAGHQ